jgi:dipeptidyl aminopeptidase/acylaminoacyl peptidase
VRGDIAKGPNDDLMSGIDRLVADGVADPARLAILATGYDGYRAAYALTRTDRFRAAVLGEPFGVDLFAFWSHPWFGAWVDQGTGGPPWEKSAAYVELSPIAHAQAIKTPTLLFCIDHDPPIAMEQCRELHHALQTLKVPTDLIVQPSPMASAFGISRTRSLLDLMRRTLAWIERWNQVAGSPAPP